MKVITRSGKSYSYKGCRYKFVKDDTGLLFFKVFDGLHLVLTIIADDVLIIEE